MTQQEMNTNPLKQYFREPGFHVELPTKGVFLAESDYTPTMAGDVPVYPMRAADEMLLKSPDALMSGHAIEKLLESCVPSIKNPKTISMPDLDILLIAIYASTYGKDMETNIQCPKCNEESTFVVDLANLISKASFVPEVNDVRLNDNLVAYLRPYNIEEATKLTLLAFNATRAIQAAEHNNLSEDNKRAISTQYYNSLSSLNIELISNSIMKITTPTDEIVNRKYISEFINNANKTVVDKIEKKLTELSNYGIDKSTEVQCPHCEHIWNKTLDFNPSTFFDQSSSI